MSTATQAPRFIYPPRPSTVIHRDELGEIAKYGYWGQLKFNDTRTGIMLKADDEYVLWSRHKTRLKYVPDEELDAEIQQLRTVFGLSAWTLIDGGLLHSKHKGIKNTLVLWDILVENGEYLLGTTYKDRYTGLIRKVLAFHNIEVADDSLEALRDAMTKAPRYLHQGVDFGIKITDHIFIPGFFLSREYDDAWKTVETANDLYGFKEGSDSNECGPILEGMVLKNPEGTLSYAVSEKNNTAWCIRCRVRTGRHRL